MQIGRILLYWAVLWWGCVNTMSILDPILPPEQILERIPIKQTGRGCNDVLLHHCQAAFNAHLNISDPGDWVDYEKFIMATDQIFYRGVENGLLVLCNARALFYQCLGASYSSCISRFHFMEKGFSQKAAAAYVEIFKELEFMCSGGILQAINHWDCIAHYKNKTDDSYKSCLDEYHNSVIEDPSNMCRAALSMGFCARLPYTLHCGFDVGWWECERVRIALDIDSYCPDQNCHFGLVEMGMADRSMARFQAFRSSNPYFMRKEKQDLFSWLGAGSFKRSRRKR